MDAVLPQAVMPAAAAAVAAPANPITMAAAAVRQRLDVQAVLSQPASSSICERINGEFAFVKDPRRNRLGHVKASKLVGLFHNLRLIHRVKKPTYTEPCVGWNEEDFKVGLTKFGVAKYAAPTKLKIEKPLRPPELTFELHETDAQLVLEAPREVEEQLRLM